MLNDADASGFKKVYLAMGFTDLRRGIDGLAGIIRFQFNLDPYDKNTLFLFCGRRCDRIKALLWEGDGFLLMYKRLDSGAFRWPRSADEALSITEEQYRMLMQGLEIVARHPMSDGTLWEVLTALYFRWTCLPDCAVPELDADYRRNNRRLS